MTPDEITIDHLQTVMPRAPETDLSAFWQRLQSATSTHKIDTARRLAAFLAVVAMATDELANQEGYDLERAAQNWQSGGLNAIADTGEFLRIAKLTGNGLRLTKALGYFLAAQLALEVK